MLKEKHPLPVVTPDWITDSIKAGKRLAESHYMLPEFKNHGIGVKSIASYASSTNNRKSENASNEIANISKSTYENKSTMGIKGATDPNFVRSYFGSSRLHLIGSFRNHVQRIVQQLQYRNKEAENHNSDYGNKADRERYIAHIDMDCFFAQVSLLSHSHLSTKPVVIAHASNSRSKADSASRNYSAAEVSAANYFARLYGISAGMFVGQARELCEHLIVLPYDFERIQRCSANVYRVILSYASGARPLGARLNQLCQKRMSNMKDDDIDDTASTSLNTIELEEPLPVLEDSPYQEQLSQILSSWSAWCGTVKAVEATSCDEVYLDISGCDEPERFLQHLRAAIYVATGCTCSAGIGRNRLLARLATRKSKESKLDAAEKISGHIAQGRQWDKDNALFLPVHKGGVFLIPDQAEAIREFMSSLDVSCLPGIGWRHKSNLEEHSIHSIRDILNAGREKLKSILGANQGEWTLRYAHGDDGDQPLQDMENRKSVGADINWGVRFSSHEEVSKFLERICEETLRRLREAASLDSGKDTNENGEQTHWHYYFRTATLRIRKRQAGAPEPKKPLGCGKCDLLSRSIAVDLRDDDVKLLSKQIKSTYQNLQIPPKELRGVGLQVSKLRLSSIHRINPRLNTYFRKACGDSNSNESSNVASSASEALKKDYSSSLTSSQIDPNVWESLPQHIQQDVLAEFQHRSDVRNSPTRISNTSASWGNFNQRASDQRRKPQPSLEQADSGAQSTLKDWKHLHRLRKHVVDRNGLKISVTGDSSSSSDGNAVFTQKSQVNHPPPLKYNCIPEGESVDLDCLAALPTNLQVEIVKEMDTHRSLKAANILRGSCRKQNLEARLDTSEIDSTILREQTLDMLVKQYACCSFEYPVRRCEMIDYFKRHSLIYIGDNDEAVDSVRGAILWLAQAQPAVNWETCAYLFEIFVSHLAAEHRFDTMHKCSTFILRKTCALQSQDNVSNALRSFLDQVISHIGSILVRSCDLV